LACISFFSSSDPAPPAIYTLSLHDALPIFLVVGRRGDVGDPAVVRREGADEIQVQGDRGARQAVQQRHAGERGSRYGQGARGRRSEEHTSELQSLAYLVCRLLLEKKKKTK